MPPAPAVSFVIPCFNSRDTVAETAMSALAQRGAPVQVIVVDDGSTDDPEAALRDAGVLDRITFIRQPNGGVSAARNRGLAAATGRYVSFLDADDLVDPDFAAEMVRLLETRGGRFAYCNYEHFADTPERERLHIRYPIHEGHVLGHILNGNFIPTPGAVLLERSLLEGRSFDARLQGTEDWWMWMQISVEEPVHHHPACLLRIRVRPGSLGRVKLAMIRDTATLFATAEQLVANPAVALTSADRSRFYYRAAAALLDSGQPLQAASRWARATRHGLRPWYHAALVAKMGLRAAGALRRVDLALWNRRLRRRPR